MNRRPVEFDEGHTMLNKLENVCLLESCIDDDGQRLVKMHDLIRDMAHQILQTKSPIMAGFELPDVDKWKEDLVRVSFIRGQFREFPSIHSPRCPSLSTLLLRSNCKLRFIADSFFKHLYGLKVLDLSYTAIDKLPNSIFDLAGLSALLLIFEKLRALKRLDLSRTLLENVPRGLECLSNLSYLRMNGCRQNEFPGGILPKLSHLQVLIMEEQVTGLYGWSQCAPVRVKGKEVACLRKLETLNCHFEHLYDFAEYLKSRDETQSLSTYQIFVGQFDKDEYGKMMNRFPKNKGVALGEFRINRDGDFQVRWPNDIEELLIGKRCPATSLCDVSSLIKYATKLEIIRLWDCISMESLVSSSWFCSAPLPSLSYNGIFSGLKVFLCFSCRSMKKLFPLVLLPNLEEIKVGWCDKMEEIIATGDEEGVMGEESSSCYSNIKFNLTKLRILELTNLPELKSICSAKLICNSLQQIVVLECWKLKRMPICLPLLDNGQPSHPPSLEEIFVSPKEWWETVVEWEHPIAKDVLLPSVKFLQ